MHNFTGHPGGNLVGGLPQASMMKYFALESNEFGLGNVLSHNVRYAFRMTLVAIRCTPRYSRWYSVHKSMRKPNGKYAEMMKMSWICVSE